MLGVERGRIERVGELSGAGQLVSRDSEEKSEVELHNEDNGKCI